jgi:pimeloyl-ACP methyl ester carboxylesterase
LTCAIEEKVFLDASPMAAEASAIVPDLTCPVLVMLGNVASDLKEGAFTTVDDKVKTADAPNTFLMDAAMQIAERCPTAEMLQFDGLGHLGPFTHPERLSAAIVEWCDRQQLRSRL